MIPNMVEIVREQNGNINDIVYSKNIKYQTAYIWI